MNKRRTIASEEAAALWTRLQEGDMTREEREEFVDWIRESPMHVEEMLRIAKVHGALERFQNWDKFADAGPFADGDVIPFEGPRAAPGSLATPMAPLAPLAPLAPIAPPAEPRPRRAPFAAKLAVAAALVCFCAVAVVWYLNTRWPQTIETARGANREITLSDGSHLSVGPETRLRVLLGEHERQVELERGVVLFHVAKDPSRPFIVAADQTRVRAVGTSFGVRQIDHAVVVTVAEGTVAVTSPVRAEPGAAARRRDAPLHGQALMLVAGQQVRVPRDGGAGPVQQVDASRALAWAQGRLVFEGESIRAVIAEFNRYNRTQIEVSDDALASRPVSGVFDARDPESFLAFLASAMAIDVSRRDDGTTIIATAR